MKKLTKQNLDELAATMNIVPAEEQLGYVGTYSNDCFWRCVAYLREGTRDEAIAEIYAQSYYKFIYGEAAAAQTLERFGSGMTASDMWDYKMACFSDGSLMGKEIGWFNNSHISQYGGPGTPGSHAVVIRSRNSDGSIDYFDPQNNTGGTIPASESRYVSWDIY